MESSTALPQELEAYLVREAEGDADQVAAFLHAMGFESPASWPAPFLLGLGLSLRVCWWEACGLDFFREAGLPAAQDLLREVVARTTGTAPEAPDTYEYVLALQQQVLALAVNHLSWSGTPIMGGEFLVGPVDEDRLVEEFARLAWQLRHAAGKILPQDNALPGERRAASDYRIEDLGG